MSYRMAPRVSRRTKHYRAIDRVSNQAEARKVLAARDSLVMVFRGRPRWLSMRCPCGCGDSVSVNLDPQAGENWHLVDDGRKIGVFPSIWRDTGCQSHFILWKNTAHFCGLSSPRRRFSLMTQEDLFGFLRANDIEP